MDIRITSISVPEIGKLINEVTTHLEDRIRPALMHEDYGGRVEQLSVFYVAISSDHTENDAFCISHNRSGQFKHLVTGRMTRYLSLAIPIDPAEVKTLDRDARFRLLEGLLIARLRSPGIPSPKGFSTQKLLDDLMHALEEADTKNGDLQ